MKTIELKPTGHFSGKNELYELFIDGNRFDDQDYSLYKDYIIGDYFYKSELDIFFTIKAEDFPDNLKLNFLLDTEPYTPLEYGAVTFLSIMKKNNDFIINYTIGFRERVNFTIYFNPPDLFTYAADRASELGMEDCEFHEEDDNTFVNFSYRTKAQGAIGSKFEEGKKIINTALNNAAKEMYEVMGKQLK